MRAGRFARTSFADVAELLNQADALDAEVERLTDENQRLRELLTARGWFGGCVWECGNCPDCIAIRALVTPKETQ